ncbi:MAG: alpha-1,4-glucan--maltose-1-phosphate maltosyltransferase [Dehalococcoidia bacterium]|nr:alpha-1,4-glucan--maltose-1-phosphate maltosyltransferase [Dehalococcoidia bacterium]
MPVEDTPQSHPMISIVDIQPAVDGGRYPVKRVVGDTLSATAVVLKGGYESLRVELRYHRPGEHTWRGTPMRYVYEDDNWVAELPLDQVGAWQFTVAAATDHFGTWRNEIERKHGAGRDLSAEIQEGVELLRHAAGAADSRVASRLESVASEIASASPERAVELALDPELQLIMAVAEPREDLSIHEPVREIWVDRRRALFGAWYELFPRSQSPEPGEHGTLRDVELQLPRLADLGFDVIYLPPIHPIGHTNRKGRNNSLVAAPDDVGSPWAIGSEEGGHDAIHPQLGTYEDLEHLVAEARRYGIEIALDFAIQCSPDHPYVRDHPEWFRQRPDGSIKYAENPPKRYEDIVALDMTCPDYPALWEELRRVVLFWVRHGIRIFRVDNPHTKPIAFWDWLIREVRDDYPDVFFLAEAFTRPRLLHQLARLGFSQSYTYFTWRNTRPELEEYLEELTSGPGTDYLRPNFFANTPDILHEYLQHGGRPAFRIRATLAATLSPTYGIYSGFELCENVALRPGSEEYLDSEKYQVRQRDWDAPGNINDTIALLNRARRENPALQSLTNLRFHNADNPNIIAYSKATPDGANRMLMIVNLDPFNAHEATVQLDGDALGIGPGSTYTAHDLFTGQRFPWAGEANYVRLDPADEPAHLFRLEGA